MSVALKAVVNYVDESKRVLDRLDRKERRVLIRTGGYGRRVFRRVIRRRKRKSAPGQPPSARAPGGSGLKDVIYRVGDGQVEIGPRKYSTKATRFPGGGQQTVRSSKPVPQLLNEGGVAQITLQSPQGQSYIYPARYRQRPFRDKAMSVVYPFFQKRIAEERL